MVPHAKLVHIGLADHDGAGVVQTANDRRIEGRSEVWSGPFSGTWPVLGYPTLEHTRRSGGGEGAGTEDVFGCVGNPTKRSFPLCHCE